MSPRLTLSPLAELHVGVGSPLDAGRVPGGRRLIIPITGGTVGGRLNGEVLPGGADWALQRRGGTATVSARYPVRLTDGTILSVTNEGTIGDRNGEMLGLTVIRIEAPDGEWAWLNDVPVVGTLVPGSGVVDLAFHTVEAMV